jgi:hypothetical protein
MAGFCFFMCNEKWTAAFWKQGRPFCLIQLFSFMVCLSVTLSSPDLVNDHSYEIDQPEYWSAHEDDCAVLIEFAAIHESDQNCVN